MAHGPRSVNDRFTFRYRHHEIRLAIGFDHFSPRRLTNRDPLILLRNTHARGKESQKSPWDPPQSSNRHAPRTPPPHVDLPCPGGWDDRNDLVSQCCTAICRMILPSTI